MLSALNKLKRERTALLIYEGVASSGWKAGEIGIAASSSCLYYGEGADTG
jgi:hypothetical protein